MTDKETFQIVPECIQYLDLCLGAWLVWLLACGSEEGREPNVTKCVTRDDDTCHVV